MNDVNDYIRTKLREAREAAGLSQRELAERVHSAQGTISDLERGRIRVNAADLVRYAHALNKSVLCFYPGVEEANLTDQEQVLIGRFRQLDPAWQSLALEYLRTQVELAHKADREIDEIVEDEVKAIEALPEEERVDAAYERFAKILSPFMKLGLRVELADDGSPILRMGPLRVPIPLEDEKDREIMRELERRRLVDS